MPYRSSKSKLTKRQEIAEQLNGDIMNYIKKVNKESDAETLWLGMLAEGYKLSQSTFNNRLKKMVEGNLVQRKSVSYNKHLYFITPANES